MLFRPQKIALAEDGAVMAADEAAVDLLATTGAFGSLGELLREAQTPPRTADLDVLDATNAAAYWDRDERFDLAISLNRGQPALAALCRVLEQWIAHFLASPSRSSAERNRRPPLGVARGARRRASALLNDLYNRVEVDEARMAGSCACSSSRSPTPPRCGRNRRPPGLPRNGDGPQPAPEAQAAESPAQPAARAAAMIPIGAEMTPAMTARALTMTLLGLVLCACAAVPTPPPARAEAKPVPAGTAEARARSRSSPGWKAAGAQREQARVPRALAAAARRPDGRISHTVMDGKTLDYEYLRLERRADGVHYVAVPSGQKETRSS